MATIPKQSNLKQTEKPVFIEGIGDVLFRRSNKAKKLRLRVGPKGVSVILPTRYNEILALQFINEKKNWIRKALKKQEAITAEKTIFREGSGFQTYRHSLQLIKHPKATIKSVVGRGQILIWYPDFAPVEDERIQEVIRRAVEETWRIEAKTYLPSRVKELAIKNNFKYTGIKFKNAKTRWGSCSARNNLNFNVQLMRLPSHLRDYVIMHELVHTVHKHHQQSFWDTLEMMMPGAKKFDRELNNYNLQYW